MKTTQCWTPIEINRPRKTDKNSKEKEVAPIYKKALTDPYGRLGYSIPPHDNGDLAFVQTCSPV
ncbi:hypothetical protein [Endozoicomonas euniceicola]|uniref:Uncharacterized protein n=1 Tax=Endozoicomonas euniceicola TaxID=1234143 RepID=A0ABY6GXR6_9GAMM|nr:hypothetical protein [Endozoicomonas euniceicola]UYM17579.1 hypothetical protein NX720_06620 [Endozoicomonas euniceicola]